MGIENRTGQYELGPDPDLESILRTRLRSLELKIRTATLGTVTAYNATTQEASVRVDVLQVNKVLASDGSVDPNETNEVTTCAPVQLTKVQVLMPGDGTGGAYLSFPIAPGCTGLLVVLDRSKDRWMDRTTPVAVDPVKSSLHSLADCIFIPGLTDRAHRYAQPADATATVLEDSLIKLGRAALKGAARLDDAVSPKAAMLAWASTVETAINALAPGTFIPGVNSFATTVANAFASITEASTKVQVE